MAFITTTANAISSGGTISGDIVIEGDLTVNGDGAGTYDEIINGELQITSTGVANQPALAIDNSTAATFIHSAEIFAGSMTANQTNSIFIGRVGSTKNSAQIGFKYSSAGANANLLTLGHWGVNESLVIDGAGNVGIGTDSPSTLLDVVNTSAASYQLSIRGDIDNDGGYVGIQFGYDGDGTAYKKAAIHVEGTGGNVTPDMHFLLNSTASTVNTQGLTDAKLSILNSGNVGIGTSSPAFTVGSGLEIEKDGPATLRLTDTGSGSKVFEVYIDDSTGAVLNSQGSALSMIFKTTGTTSLTLDTSQNATFAGDIRLSNNKPLYASTTGGATTSLVVLNSSNNLMLGQSNANHATTTLHGGTGNVFIRAGSALVSTFDTSGNVTISSGSAIQFGDSSYKIIGSTAGNYLRFYTESTQALQIDDSQNATFAGNVGIGTTSPVTMLNLKGDGTSIITLETSDTTQEVNNLTGAIYFRGNDATSGAGGTRAMIKANAQDSSGGHYMSFSTAPSAGTVAERVRIDMDGNVGIGTSSPAELLHVKKSTGDVGLTIESVASGTSPKLRIKSPADRISAIEFYEGGSLKSNIWHSTDDSLNFNVNSAGDNALSIASNKNATFGGSVNIASGLTTTGAVLNLQTNEPSVVANDVLGRINFQAPLEADGADGDARLVGASIHALVTASDFNDAKNTTDLVFSTAVSETASEKMRITSAGDVGIGVTPETSHSSVTTLQVGGLSAITATTAQSAGSSTWLGNNVYINSSGSQAHIVTDEASVYRQVGGTHNFQTVASGSADAGISFTTNMVIDINSRISLSNNDSGGTGGADSTTGNTIFGYGAGIDIASGGLNNTSIGHASGFKLTTGDDNTYLGLYAGLGNLTGSGNTFIGSQSGLSDNGSSHSNNTAVGKDTLKLITDGAGNTVMGSTAGDAITTESNCTLIGQFAGSGINSADANGSTAVGNTALWKNTSGRYNTAIGFQSLAQNLIGDSCTALGYQALTSSLGNDNTAIGYLAGTALTSGASNTMLGAYAGDAMTTSNDNVGIGLNAIGQATTLTDRVVAIGSGAMGGGISTADITGLVSIGYESLAGSLQATTDYTVGIGYQSLMALTSGASNTAVGYQSAKTLTTGASNVALGHQAMDELVDGSRNVAIGHNAMGNVVGGTTSDGSSDNVFIGYNSGGGGWTDAACNQNIGIGTNVLDGALEGALNNTGVGHGSLGAVTQGDNNVGYGYLAGDTITTGASNTIIGASADVSASGATNQIVIGQGATGVADNSVTLGNASVTAVYMAQDSGAVVHCSGVNFPDTQVASGDANTLDDYEEGDWTGTGTNVASAPGFYTKVGNLVTCVVTVNWNGAGIMSISGLPFASINREQPIGSVMYTNVDLPANTVQLNCSVDAGGSTVTGWTSLDNASRVANTVTKSGSYTYLGFSYMA